MTSTPDVDLALYRPCVGIMLINQDGKIFAGQRLDAKENGYEHSWQMPQGGVDDGEENEDALWREMAEEIGLTQDHATLMGEHEGWLLYETPDHLREKLQRMWGKPYIGQKQKWYLLRFTGEDADVNLAAHDPIEFETWKWMTPLELLETVVPFKKDTYTRLIAHFEEMLHPHTS